MRAFATLLPLLILLGTQTAHAAFVTSKHKDEYTRLNFNWESQVEYDLKQKDNIVTLRFKRSHPITKAQLDAQLKNGDVVVRSIAEGKDFLELAFELKKPGHALTLNKDGLVVLDIIYDNAPPKKEKSEANKELDHAKDVPKPQTKPVLEKKSEPKLPNIDQQKHFLVDAEPAPQQDIIQIGIDETTEGLKLTFEFTKETKAGAFIEAGDLWLYFDQPVKFSWDETAMNASQFITDLITYKSNSLAAVKIDLSTEPNKTSFYRRGNQWVFETADLQGITPTLLELTRKDDKLILTHDTLGEPILAQMPTTGTSRYFIPSSGDTIRLEKKHRYADVYLQPTILGAVIDPLSEGVSVTKKDKSVVIEKDKGLALSAASDLTQERSRYKPPSLLNFVEWTSNGEDTAQNKRDYEWEIISTPKGARTPKRLELVRHYILTGRYYEASGLLASALVYDSSLEKSPYFHSLKGLAAFACHHFDEAYESFNNPVLAGDPEMKMWAELSKCANHPSDANTSLLSTVTSYVDTYPPFFRDAALLYAADAAITQKKDDKDYLSHLKREEMNPRQQEHFDYLSNYNEVQNSKTGEAMVQLEKNSKRMKSEYGLKSGLLLLQIKADDNSLLPKDEVKELEKMRYRWSGDRSEYDLWMRLSDRYQQLKDYEHALKYIRKGIRNYPKLAKRDNLQQKGEKLFLNALSDQNSDLLMLLALYQEYDLFIPVDDRRFKIQSQLVDLLVKADLVDQAMTLMDQIVQDTSLQDDQRVRMRTRYGLLALLNDQPDKALKVLNYQEGEQVPEDMVEQRKFLVAQINLMQGKYEAVYSMLKDNYTPAGYELLAQAYVADKKWDELIDYTETYLEGQKEGQKIDQAAVLMLSTAYGLKNNEHHLKKLRETYLKDMTDSPFKEAFELITAEDPTDFSTKGLNKELANSQQLTKYLEAYRQKVKEHGLSAM